MTGGIRYSVYAANGVELFVYVTVREQRPQTRQTVLLLGMFAQGTGAFEVPRGNTLGVDAFNGGRAQLKSFDAAANAGWLVENLEVTVSHDLRGKAVQVPIVWRWGCREANRPGGILRLDLEPMDLVSQPSFSFFRGTLGQDITIFTNPKTEGVTHVLTYTLNDGFGLIAEQVQDRFTWTLPAELADHMPTRQDSCQITCTTLAGDEVLGNSTRSLQLLIGDAGNITVREGWCSFIPDSGLISDAWGVYLEGRSRVRAMVDESKLAPGRGAQLQSIVLEVAGEKYGAPWHSGILPASGKVAARLKVTDSRGSVLQHQTFLEVLPYGPPAVSGGQCFRCLDDGTPHDGGDHVFVTGTPVCYGAGGHNRASLRLRLCTPAGQELSREPVEDGMVCGGSLNAHSSYLAILEAVDALGEVGGISFPLPAQTVAFQIREGGDGAAFGGPATQADCLKVYWNHLEVGGQPVADFPVETGSGGIWSWRKWNSGLAECWGSITGTAQSSQAWGQVFATGSPIYAQYPFPFVEAPHVQATPVYQGHRNYWLSTCDDAGSKTRTPGYQLTRGDNLDIRYRLDFFCLGRWK